MNRRFTYRDETGKAWIGPGNDQDGSPAERFAQFEDIIYASDGQPRITLERLREMVDADEGKETIAKCINHGMGVSGEYDIEANLLCPKCGAVVGDAEYMEQPKFCQECGQKLILPTRAEAEAALAKGADNAD